MHRITVGMHGDRCRLTIPLDNTNTAVVYLPLTMTVEQWNTFSEAMGMMIPALISKETESQLAAAVRHKLEDEGVIQ